MKRKLALLFLVFSLSHRLYAQKCDCEKELDFVQQYMERNNPSLNSGVRHTAAYKNGLAKVRKEIRAVKPDAACILYLSDYLELVRDHHVSISPNIPDIIRPELNTPSAVDSFYKSAAFLSTPRREIDTARIIAEYGQVPGTGIVGHYSDGSGNLVAFFKDSLEKFSYKGVYVRSTSKLFPVGTVRYEILERPDGKLLVSVVLADHKHKVYAPVQLTQSGLPIIGLKKVGSAPAEAAKALPFSFSMINDSTAYIRVSSFDADLYQQLQNFYQSIDSQVRATPYLVVDVRDNSGGSEQNYGQLLDYIVTGPLQYGKTELWVAPENIKRYEESLARKQQQPDKYSRESMERDENIIALMKAAKPFQFYTYGDAMTLTPDTVLALPKKVAVLMNRSTASAAEGFVLRAQQSTKVITMGENSGGYVGFGDVLPVKTPYFGYTLNNTILRFGSFYPYEYKGIPPNIKLSPGKDWVKEALQVLYTR